MSQRVEFLQIELWALSKLQGQEPINPPNLIPLVTEEIKAAYSFLNLSSRTCASMYIGLHVGLYLPCMCPLVYWYTPVHLHTPPNFTGFPCITCTIGRLIHTYQNKWQIQQINSAESLINSLSMEYTQGGKLLHKKMKYNKPEISSQYPLQDPSYCFSQLSNGERLIFQSIFQGGTEEHIKQYTNSCIIQM